MPTDVVFRPKRSADLFYLFAIAVGFACLAVGFAAPPVGGPRVDYTVSP